MKNNWFIVDRWERIGKIRSLEKIRNDFFYSVTIDTYIDNQYTVTYELYKKGKALCKGEFCCEKLSQAKFMETQIRCLLAAVYIND